MATKQFIMSTPSLAETDNIPGLARLASASSLTQSLSYRDILAEVPAILNNVPVSLSVDIDTLYWI